MSHKTYRADFRTRPAGSYKWMKGLTRGYWRLLEIDADATGIDLRSRGVREIYRSPDGLAGVTERSSYYIENYGERFKALATELNQFSIMGILDLNIAAEQAA